MVCRLLTLVLILFLGVNCHWAAANEEPALRQLTAETAAIFALQQPNATDGGAQREAQQEPKEADESDKEDSSEEDKSEPEPAAEKDEDEDEDAAEKKEPTKADETDDDQADDKEAEKKDDKADAESAKAKSSDEKESAEEKKPEAKKPATVEAKTKDLKIQVEADGVFVAEEAEEVALRPEVWTSFKVVEAVPHGKRVRKGEALVRFDEKDIDEALAEKALQQRLGELALMAAEEEFPRTEKAIVLNYDQAKREYEQAQDEQERFQEKMREMSEKMAEYYLKSAEQDFESAQEELDQLLKMYEADELTEETEEIVLRRQKFQVEAAKFFVDYSKLNHEYTMNVSIPRRAEMLKTAVEMAEIEFERAKMAKSLGMNKQRYELQALRESRARSVDEHAKLVEDRELMTLKTPADGIAYYGRQVNGRWVEVSSMEQKLVPFGTVTPNSVVMTVVKDRPLYVETSIGEKELPTVKAEQEVVVVPAADSEVELKGAVEKVADVPGGGNKFTVRIELKAENAPDWLMPGMTGKVKITTYEAEDAVVIPADAVQSDEDDPKEKYVMLQVDDEEKPVRRDIKLGKTKDKEVEVLDGLKEGDEIVKGVKDKKDESESQESEDEESEDEKAEQADDKE